MNIEQGIINNEQWGSFNKFILSGRRFYRILLVKTLTCAKAGKNGKQKTKMVKLIL